MRKKRSFFEKITGAVRIDDFDEDEENEIELVDPNDEEENLLPEDSGQLSIDVVNNEDEIIIKAMIAGVKPQDLDIQISRDMITITGSREEESEIAEEDYYHRELYWGSFARNILLPEEINVEEAVAQEKHGLLIIKLPKIDKDRKTTLSVKSS